jgi:hypothetical protein
LQIADNLRSKTWLLVQIEMYEGGTELSTEAMLAKLREEWPHVDHWGIVGEPGKHMALVYKKPTVRIAPPAIAGHNLAVYSVCTGAGAQRARTKIWETVSAWSALPGERISEFEFEVTGRATSAGPGSSADSHAAGGGFVTAREAFELVKDMSNRDFTLFMADLKVKEQIAKERKEVLPPPERTLMLLRVEVDTMRQKRLAARGYLRHVATAGALCWPDDFVNLSLIEGRVMNEATGKDEPLTFTKYLTSSVHLRMTCILYGPPGTGKTPLAEAAAARLALSYQEEAEYYVLSSTPDSLRRVAEEGLLTPAVPIVLDELDAGDTKMHRSRLSANFVKNMCGVRGTGTIAARYQDFAFPERAPRFISTNAATPEEWLNDIGGTALDRDAIRKRIAFFHVPLCVVPASAKAGLDAALEAEAAKGAMRLAKKLGRPL